jgi:protein-disulfide isomerase
MERDDVRKELGAVRRRREEAIRAEADLARHQVALEARLADLKLGAPDLVDAYGLTASPADLTTALHAWRLNIRSVSALRTDVREGRDHLRGDPGAPLVLVEYGDYQCAECAEAHALRARVTSWIDEGRLCFAFRHFPLVDAHPLALREAQAAEAAAAQGRFWAMHDAMMRRVSDARAQGLGPATGDPTRGLEHLARGLGLDLERFRIDIDAPAVLERVLDDFRDGLASGVNGTPTFYLGGRRVDAGEVEELYAQVAAAAGAAAP